MCRIKASGNDWSDGTIVRPEKGEMISSLDGNRKTGTMNSATFESFFWLWETKNTRSSLECDLELCIENLEGRSLQKLFRNGPSLDMT